MVREVVAGLQELLQQEQAPTETPETISEQNKHVANAVQITQQKLAIQLQQMKTMMQAMQLQYDAAPHPTHQDYRGRRYYGGKNSYQGRGGCGSKYQVNWRCGHGV